MECQLSDRVLIKSVDRHSTTDAFNTHDPICIAQNKT